MRIERAGPTSHVLPITQMVDFLRMVGDAETLVSHAATRLNAGSKVRIKSGRLEGMEGYVHRKPNGSTMLALCV